MPRRAAAPHPALEVAETPFQNAVIELATRYSWLAYHTHDSRRSVAGFPDLVLWNPRQRRVIFAELKKQDGVLSDEQRATLRTLAASGAETALWRPADMPQINLILAGRRITQDGDDL